VGFVIVKNNPKPLLLQPRFFSFLSGGLAVFPCKLFPHSENVVPPQPPPPPHPPPPRACGNGLPFSLLWRGPQWRFALHGLTLFVSPKRFFFSMLGRVQPKPQLPRQGRTLSGFPFSLKTKARWVSGVLPLWGITSTVTLNFPFPLFMGESFRRVGSFGPHPLPPLFMAAPAPTVASCAPRCGGASQHPPVLQPWILVGNIPHPIWFAQCGPTFVWPPTRDTAPVPLRRVLF